jgi:hypothetical protein
MNKRGLLVIAAIALLLSLINFASADIFLSKQPEDIYNLGDTMNVVLGSDGTEGWASVNLACSNQTKMIYFRYLTDETAIDIFAPFNKEFLRGMMGNCFLALNFNGKPKQSFAFIISDKIDVTFSLGAESFMPGEGMSFTGGTNKPDGNLVANGYAELKFNNINLDLITPIVNNQFAGNFTIPENLAAGAYSVIVSVYEKDKDGGITNTGSASSSLTVLQKPNSVKISTQSKVFPGKEIKYSAILYDQTGQVIEKSAIAYEITDSKNNSMVSKLSTTGEDNYYTPAKNAPYGDWKLKAESEGIASEVLFYVDKNMEALFELTNGTLSIRNIGNVPYEKKIEMRIGNVTEVKYLNLSEGESVQFELSAPDGTYDVGVSDGENSADWKGVPLTGAAISFDSGKNSSLGFFNRNWIAWAFLIAVLGLFVFLSSRKILNKNVFLSEKNKPNFVTLKKPVDKEENFFKQESRPNFKPASSTNLNAGGGVVKLTPAAVQSRPQQNLQSTKQNLGAQSGAQQPKINTQQQPKSINRQMPTGVVGVGIDSGYAVYSPVIDGVRQKSSLVAVKIKNAGEIKQKPEQTTNDTVKGVIQIIMDNHGKVYKTEELIVGLFVPMVTRTFDNEASAVKTAKLISDRLKGHNAKFTQKIQFGVGVNTGDIALKRDSQKLLFSPLGSTLLNAKKMAEMANGNVLIGEDIQKKISQSMKTTLNVENISSMKTYFIGEPVRRATEENSRFVEDFLKRNKEFGALRTIRNDSVRSENKQTNTGNTGYQKSENNQKGFEFLSSWK